MLCKDSKPLLNALADGELSPLTAWRVRRHLRHCSNCSQEYADIQRIGNMAHAWADATNTSASDALRAYVQNTLAPTAAHLSALRKEPKKMTRFIPALVISSTVLVAALVGTNHIVSISHPVAGVAFAQVQEAVDTVRTAHVTFRMESTDISESSVMYEAWLQAEPARFAVLTPATRMVGDVSGVVQYVDGEAPMRITDTPITRTAVRKEMLFPSVGIKNTVNAPGKWGTGTLEQDATGHTLLRFLAEDNGVRRTLWANPDTHLPVLIEVETHGAEGTTSGAENSSAGSRFRIEYFYNQTPPADIFAPPVGSAKLATKVKLHAK